MATFQPIVVVADDDPGMRRLLGRALGGSGYTVLLAMDVREAMDHLRRPGIAAAILDVLFVNSAGLSGLDLLQFIRRDPFLADLPVIIMSGFQLNREVVTQVEAHHAEMWVKPFDVARLTRRLGELIHK